MFFVPREDRWIATLVGAPPRYDPLGRQSHSVSPTQSTDKLVALHVILLSDLVKVFGFVGLSWN